LDGRIVHRSYKDKEERTVYVTEVVVENINKLANAGGSSSALPGNENYGQNTSPSVSLQNKQTIASTNFDYSSGGNVESSSAQDDANDEIVPFDGESDKN
jgi:single-stranded DNA-binding protein